MVKAFFNYFIFPGFLFSAVIGLLAGWLDRKLTARIQWRIGPPWHQNFTDIIKLTVKEVTVPIYAGKSFFIAPFLALASISLVSYILGLVIMSPQTGFSADIIVVLYLLTIPALALIIGASSSANPLASVGASREMKLILAYELPFIISIISVIVKNQGVIQLKGLLTQQAMSSSNIMSLSGAFAFTAIFLCMQAKLGMAPFEVSEAEQEIMAGVLIEYSGVLLAAFKLTKALMLYTVPVFIICLFLGKDTSPLFLLLKFLCILLGVILIKNTNPRLRIDQVLRFFWRVPLLLAVISLVLAFLGK